MTATGRRALRSLGRASAVAALLAFTLFPAYFMVASALTAHTAPGTEALLPTEPTLAHFTHVLTRTGFPVHLRNSVVVALLTVVGSVLLALFAAVAVARFRFRTTVLVVVLVVQMVLLEALVISLFLLARDLAMLDSLVGLAAVYVALSLPFAVWTLRGFVAAVPVEVEEAALIDGASWSRIFWSVLLPLTAPGLVACSVFSFTTAWNEFVLVLTFMSTGDKFTAAVGLRRFFGLNTTAWGPAMAASTLITLPVAAFFLSVQRGLAQGLVAGAVKG